MHRQIFLIIVSAILLGIASLIEHRLALPTWQLLLIYLVPYLLVGHETLHEAVEGIAHGDWFNEHFLMSIATIGALCIGFMPGAETQFPEAVFVMLFFQIGEMFEEYAEGKSRDSISHLLELKPATAHVERNGEVVEVAPEHIDVGEVMVVRPGDKVALDGIVIEGNSTLNTMALTGESLPREVQKNDEVLSGCINLSGVLRVRTQKAYHESTVSKILDLMENANEHKSKSESFITRFARVYTPIVVGLAFVLAFLPPLFTGNYLLQLPVWLHRALIFLVVSCPCALVISVPLTFFGGLGGASRKGILIKGANLLDRLAHTRTVVLDKTGTLTYGRFAVEAVHPEQYDASHLLHLAAHVEHYSTHPVATALRDAYPEEATDGCHVSHIKEIPGQGIQAQVGNDVVNVGNERMMDALSVAWHPCHKAGTIIHIAINGEYAGHIVITDQIKSDSPQAIQDLHTAGVKNIIMLTGDSEDVAKEVAARLHISQFYAHLLPQDKVAHIERIIAQQAKGEYTVFAGDGINDAPVLARADIGIAMGALGSDAAIEAADVVIMDDQPTKIATAIRVARHTTRIARQNVVFAIAVKVAVLILAAIGWADMSWAVFADVGVTVLAVLNAMRALR
ncbi:MAG: cadmium-translocating P-type ATPase [Paludibacteraceae bacterium]|nr:cadmium-translocating P-type ATPase [Paludibacteraceae bacterium]